MELWSCGNIAWGYLVEAIQCLLSDPQSYEKLKLIEVRVWLLLNDRLQLVNVRTDGGF